MKKILISAILLATTSFYAQDGKVGIGNTAPKATLDVTGTPATATVADGIIAPRLTGDQLAAKDAVYLANQTGAQVYVTAAATSPAGKTINVTAPGYYYLDNSAVWQKYATGGKTKFVDGTDPLNAVYTGGKVGIGTINPLSKLNVIVNNPDLTNGDGIIVGINSSTRFAQLRTADNSKSEGWPTGGVLELLQSDNTTSGSKLSSASNSYFNSNYGNVGIGTNTPIRKLHVGGTAYIGVSSFTPTSNARFNVVSEGTNFTMDVDHFGNGAGDAGSTLRLRGARGTSAAPTAIVAGNDLGSIRFAGHDGTNFLGSSASIAAVAEENFTSNSYATGIRLMTLPSGSAIVQERMRITSSGSVGIGRTTPSEKLDINGNTILKSSGLDSSQNLGEYRFGNVGNTTINASVGAIRGVTNFGQGNLVFNTSPDDSGAVERMRITETGRVGIGTTVPSKKLHVVGDALISSLSGTGNRMVVADETGVLSTQAIPSGSIADGSETKINPGTNVTITGTGTTASPYVVNATGAIDATSSANGVVRLAGDLSGTATTPTIAPNAVTSSKIANGTIAEVDIAPGAVTSTLMSAGAGTTGRIPVANATGNITYTDVATAIPTIYSGDSNLTGNRIVNQVDKTLAFTSTATSGTSHFTVDGSTFNVNAVDNRVGIGTLTPSRNLHVGGTAYIGVSTFTPTSNARFNVVSEGGTNFTMEIDHFGNGAGDAGSTLRLRGARGTSAAPTAIVAGNDLGSIRFSGHDGANFLGSSASIAAVAEENFTSNSYATGIRLMTLPSGSAIVQERMRITSSGSVGIGTTTPGSKLAVVGLPVYADNTAAAALSIGDFYRTSTGVVMVKY
ncbi:hypothetical protein ACFO3U_08365 [Flavobacterium ponti]|uniref:Uncharacterized protein n=1 Tax=Flavobacterium ponti TaxID=665133 RepID=A0ABV9P5M3_9FLAO